MDFIENTKSDFKMDLEDAKRGRKIRNSLFS